MGGCSSNCCPSRRRMGLLALMLLQESRRAARALAGGEIILLADQDRSLWNREQIAEGAALVERALASRRFGPYTLQAAIAAVHAEAPRAEATDWNEIVGPLRPPAAGGSLAGHRAEPRGRRGHARRPRRGPRADRRDPRARRARGLPPRPRGTRRPLPAAGPKRGGPGVVRAGDGARPAGARAAIPRARRLAELPA